MLMLSNHLKTTCVILLGVADVIGNDDDSVGIVKDDAGGLK